MKRNVTVTGERCLTLRDHPHEKKAFDDDDDGGNMVVIAETAAAAPNPPKTDLRLSRKRKCDSKAVQDGEAEAEDENWPASMASSYKGSKGQPSKRTRSNMQPKVGSCLLAPFMPR